MAWPTERHPVDRILACNGEWVVLLLLLRSTMSNLATRIPDAIDGAESVVVVKLARLAKNRKQGRGIRGGSRRTIEAIGTENNAVHRQDRVQ